MKKIFNIAILILFVVIIFLAAYVYVAQKKAAQKNNATPAVQPIAPTVVPQENEEKMTIQTGSGDVAINNLYKNPIAKLYHNGVLFQQASGFEMSFYPDDSGFIISLLNPDLQKSRDEAETAFLNTLGIDQKQACLLKVSLGTTADINEKAAGQNFGLIFCPNGKPLPAN
jgi:hypothetical protein